MAFWILSISLIVGGAALWTILVLAGQRTHQVDFWRETGTPILCGWLIAAGLLAGLWLVTGG